MKEGARVFGQRTEVEKAAAQERENELYEQIGRLKVGFLSSRITDGADKGQAGNLHQ
jgi:hypothetical protein